jgi:hypothetical protein
MEKSQNMPVWLSKMGLPLHVSTLAKVGKRPSKAVHLQEKSVINMI